MRRVTFGFVLLTVLALPALPAHAQGQKGAQQPTPEELEQKRENEALDRQYKATLRRTDQGVTPPRADPWANMRGDNAKK